MKIILTIIAIYGAFPSKCRLTEKNTYTTPESTNVASTKCIRAPRHISDDEVLTVYSKEYNPNAEAHTKYPAKIAEPNNATEIKNQLKALRILAGKGLGATSYKQNNSTNSSGKDKINLVRKAIPKYNEIEDDDDFQMKVLRSSPKLIESGEHEDEDFNLNDYDFDVNHDEFVGSGKPLEPRVRQKGLSKKQEKETPNVEKQRAVPTIATTTIVMPTVSKPEEKPKVKSVSKREQGREENFSKNVEDYDDDSMSTKETVVSAKTYIEDSGENDDNEDSSESTNNNIKRVNRRSTFHDYTGKVNEKYRIDLNSSDSKRNVMPMAL